jgi:hypothetical protein
MLLEGNPWIEKSIVLAFRMWLDLADPVSLNPVGCRWFAIHDDVLAEEGLVDIQRLDDPDLLIISREKEASGPLCQST